MQIIEKTKKLLNVEKGNLKRTLLKAILAVPFWITVVALFLIIFGISRAMFLTSSRPDQYVAEEWQGNSDTAFRHMSVYAGGVRASGDTSPMTYMEGGKSIHLADIALIRASLQSVSSSGNGGAAAKNIPASDGKLRGWEDCYSSTVKGTLEAIDIRDGKEEVSAGKVDAQIVAVGGNFKAFHPFRYMAGGFLPETPVDTYQIVINDVLAWKFYHSYDVIGNKININGQMFTIIGVVEEKSTKTAELAGEQDNRAFIYFGALGTVFNGGASAKDDAVSADASGVQTGAGSDYAIQCYEALLPELVEGVAVSDFKSAMPSYSLTNPQVYVADNTGRFGIIRVFDTFFPIGETAKTRAGYEFPYWETAAQMTEDRLVYDYAMTGIGIILLLTGAAMIALKLRARKAVAPEELSATAVDEAEEEAKLLLES